jgi:DNA repair protein SbcD/Mre11
VKILHTADIHLKRTGDERWESLHHLLSVARDQGIGAFVISGDLFDKDLDAENLRPEIRALFSGNGFPVIMIPGNHDIKLLSDMYFGSDAVLIRDHMQPHIVGDVAFYGMAFESMNEHRVLQRLGEMKAHLSPERTNILLYHGELLDVMFKRSDLGGEEETGYMPVRLSFFKDMKIDYVLAGHFHTRFDIRQIPGGGFFVYPGSPVSITRRETGRRKVNIFEAGNPPAEFLLDTPHFEEVVLTLNPLDHTDPLELIDDRLRAVHERAKVLLTVDGYFNQELTGYSERELADRIESTVRERCADIRLEFTDIRHILADDLFSLFMSKLTACDFDPEKQQLVRDLAIRAMIEARS